MQTSNLMETLNSKEELMHYLINNKVEPTGFISEIDEDEIDYCDIIKNKKEYGVTEHLVISSKEKELIIKYFGSVEAFGIETNIDFISEEINDTPIEFIHLSNPRFENSIRSKGLVSDYCSYVTDLGFGIYAIESNCEQGLDNVKTFFEDYEDNYVLVVKGKYNSHYTKCIYGIGHEGYIVLSEDVEPSLLSFEIMEVDDFLLL